MNVRQRYLTGEPNVIATLRATIQLVRIIVNARKVMRVMDYYV